MKKRLLAIAAVLISSVSALFIFRKKYQAKLVSASKVGVLPFCLLNKQEETVYDAHNRITEPKGAGASS